MICQLYRHFDAQGRLLYVGISLSVVGRLMQHMSGSAWAGEIATITVESFPTREAAIEAERKAIGAERPQWNTLHVKGSDDLRMAFPPEFDRSYYDEHGLPHLVATFCDSMGRKVDAEFTMDEGREVTLRPRAGNAVSLDFSGRERLDRLCGDAVAWSEAFSATDQYARLGSEFTL